MKTKWMLAGVATAVAVAAVGTAWAAEEGIRIGPLRLSAWGELSLTYDDNARLVVPDGEIQDRQIFEDIDDGVRAEQQDDFFYEATLGPCASSARPTTSWAACPASIRPAATRTSTISTTRAWAKRRKSASATAS